MFNPTIEQVQKAYKKKNYNFFTNGDYNINLYGIRKGDIFDNLFSDTLGIIYGINGVLQQINIPGTTKPGLFGKGAVMDPRPDGVAIIVPGQYRSVWKFVDDYNGWLNYPYFYQVGKFRIWRDWDKDTELDHTNEQDVVNAGLNCHRMSWNNVEGQPAVNNWSEGCQGAEEPQYKKFLDPVRNSVKLYGDTFSYTLFNKKDFD